MGATGSGREGAMPGGLGDEALLAGMAVGDMSATVAFIRRFQRKVYGLARSLVADAGRAEDVAQQAFERAWRHADLYDPRRGSVQAWLLTITRNLAIDQLRSARAVTVGGWEHFADPASSSPGPEERALAADAAARLREAMARLPAAQARALALAAFGGLTASEIAQAEGIPLGTAKTRVRSAMLKLRESLAAEEAAP